MSMFERSYCTSISGGTFSTNTTYQTLTATPTAFEKLVGAVSPNAFHHSDNRPDPPKCHPNTRVAVVKKIFDWVTDRNDADTFILWLYGPAGAGKTAISRTVAEFFAMHKLLLASFLFFRSDAQRNTMASVVANIAYDVASVVPYARKHIEAVIEADPLIFSYSVEAQFTKLVIEPLRLLADQGYFLFTHFPRLVVIDGLDECLDRHAQTNLIQLLSSSVARKLPFKFLIVSRPEAHIKLAVDLAGEQSTVSHLELNNDFQPDEDIRRFLIDKLHQIKTCHPLRLQIPSFWPSEQQIQTLVRKASGQFIYASLAVRFINSASDLPTRQLDIILELRPPIDHNLPFAELDTLYTYILSCAKNVDLVLRIISVNEILADDLLIPEVVVLIEDVLGLESSDVCIHLSALGSLLEVQGRDGDQTIVFHHKSLMDFLRTRERSKEYFVHDRVSHTLIAQSVMQDFTSHDPSVCQGTMHKWSPRGMLVDLAFHLTQSLWTLELECALKLFSLPTYLDCLDRYNFLDGSLWRNFDLLDQFFNYLQGTGKPELYRHHAGLYLEHVVSSSNNPPMREKLHLLSTVWFVLQEPFTSLWMYAPAETWQSLCATLFGFSSEEIDWDSHRLSLLCHPTKYEAERSNDPCSAYGHFAKTERLVLKPILSHRLARVAILCIRYLRRQDSNISQMQGHIRTWAKKSKRSPWLWRQRMRVTSMRRQLDSLDDPETTYSFPQSLRRVRSTLFPEQAQSEKFYRVKRISYIWTLDLLYHTLRKALKSDELTQVLSEPFVPSSALFLFPRRIKRIRKVIDTYLEKFSPRNLDTPTGVIQNIVGTSGDANSDISERVVLTGRDAMEKDLKRNIDAMLGAMYGPTGLHPETFASLNAAFNQVNKLGGEIRSAKQRST